MRRCIRFPSSPLKRLSCGVIWTFILVMPSHKVWTGDLPQKMHTSNSKDYARNLKLDKTLALFYELRIILENNKKLEV